MAEVTCPKARGGHERMGLAMQAELARPRAFAVKAANGSSALL
ncbi:hypothetical protein PZN02_002744 [Sinorhizobium garamanticum]|uniref:Uncharacterized protein n=1 Tax=Sinorhizobium garamanticum TaxID=680247 RepID=A0ABY8D6F7_9HYPH|nr:hypothetical protein [Sinorhizobium garamanticum]WEX86460.1 hypothetical protein PZN02_002744 [Sinorhizobium garamanticum]